MEAGSLVVATGGLSIPKIGATPFGYRLARQFGLKVIDCRPALVPFTFGGADREKYEGLAGVAALVTAETGGAAFREKLLFTHRGLSGPAILQVSSYWQPGRAVAIDLLPGVDLAALLRDRRLERDRSEARTIVSRFLPKRLADRWFELYAPSRPAAALSDREIEAISGCFHRWEFQPAGTEGYEKAEVTAGGVDTAEIVVEDLRSAARARAVFHRRGGGRHRPSRRLQFSMGLGIGILGGSVRVGRNLSRIALT